MAKKRFRIKDKQGNPVDYDISSASVTIDVEGKSLDVKLSELANAIAAAVTRVVYNDVPHNVSNGAIDIGSQMQADWNESSQQYPAYIKNKPNVVTGIKVGESGSVRTPSNGVVTIPEGGSTIAPDNEMSETSENVVKNKVIKAYVDNIISGLINGAPQALDTLNELSAALGNDANFAATITNQLANKANSADVYPKSQTYNKSEVDTALGGKLGVNDVSAQTPTTPDGTFTIHVGENAYTINLNHTHENMAKVVKCTEATRPQTLENDTIYVQVNNATTPTEIESLWLFGLEFTGGGAAPGTPRLTSPSQSQISSGIDIGRTTNGTVSYDLKIKARDLTQSLLVEWGSGSTGYSFNTSNLPTGVTYDSGTGKLTITKEAACGINGVNIPVVYTGNDTDEDAEGTIGISSSSVDGINVEVTLVANKLDTDGLIAHWDAEDAPSSGAWVDRINSMKLNLGGTATKGNDGYRLDNTGAPKNAWLYLDSADKSTMNNLISKEFTCIVDCQVKFSATGMSANIIDFGNLGTSLSNASIRAYVKQEGKLAHSLKQGDNAVSATVNNEQIPAFTTGSYIPMRIICGAKLVNGVQRFFARFGSAEVYSDLATPVVINFSGCTISNTVADYAFAAGIAYFSNSMANSDLSNYKVDVIYERILLYNKTLN